MNHRGVEGLPFGFLVSILVLSLVLAGGFHLIDSLISFSSGSGFLDDINRVRDRISFLKTGDVNSFSSISVTVPSGERLVFEGNSISFGDYSLQVNCVFRERNVFESGNHGIVLCYGNCEEVSNLVEFE